MPRGAQPGLSKARANLVQVTPAASRIRPKVELHCHLEGTIAPATVAELASKNGHRLPAPSVEDLYTFDSLNGFLEIFWFVQALLATPEDWERAAYESVVHAAPHGLRYAETFFTPARHLAAGQDLGGIVEGITRGFEAAEAETGVRSMALRHRSRVRRCGRPGARRAAGRAPSGGARGPG